MSSIAGISDGRRLLIQIAEEIIQRPVHAHIHIDGRMHLHRIEFHMNATAEQNRHQREK